MKNIQNIVLTILGLAVAILYFLHFKSNSPKINMQPSMEDMAVAIQTSRVGLVNIDTFFGKYDEYKKIKSQLESSQKSTQMRLEGKLKSLQGEYQNLIQQAQTGQITSQEAQTKEKSIMNRMNSLKSEEEKLVKGLANKMDKATKDLYEKVEDYFGKNKEKYNVDFVMGYETNGVILYSDKSLDITNQLVEDLNKADKK